MLERKFAPTLLLVLLTTIIVGTIIYVYYFDILRSTSDTEEFAHILDLQTTWMRSGSGFGYMTSMVCTASMREISYTNVDGSTSSI